MRSVLDRLEGEVTALAAVPAAGLPVGSLQVRGQGQGLVPDPDVAGATLPTAAWPRHATSTTGNAAGRQIRTSVALRELPAVVDAIVDDEITLEHGRTLMRLVGKIEPQALLDSQPQLIEVARHCDPDQLADYVRHLLATHCEPVLEDEEGAAEDRRFLQLRNKHNGSWRGIFELPDVAMEIVLTALEPLARRDGDDDKRTAGHRRADALTDVFGLALRFADLPDAGGSRPLLTHVVPAWWTPGLAGAMKRLTSDPLATLDLDRHPGQDIATGPWTGPATRSRIGTLLCDSRVQRVVLDADGQIISLTSVTDQITAAQRRAVAARDRCCATKGCSKPPAFCDVHHLRARADGGRSTIHNLVLLCRRHHVMWHRGQLGLTDLRVPWMRLPQQPRAPALQ